MSKASDWVFTYNTKKPQPINFGGAIDSFEVTDEGLCLIKISGCKSHFSASEALQIRDWLTDTFDEIKDVDSK